MRGRGAREVKRISKTRFKRVNPFHAFHRLKTENGLCTFMRLQLVCEQSGKEEEDEKRRSVRMCWENSTTNCTVAPTVPMAASSQLLSPPPLPPPVHQNGVFESHRSLDTNQGTCSSDLDLVSLKRQYLSLLSTTEVIDFCLALDCHASSSAQTHVWPTDLQATIARLTSPALCPTPTPLSAAAEAHASLSAPPPLASPPIAVGNPLSRLSPDPGLPRTSPAPDRLVQPPPPLDTAAQAPSEASASTPGLAQPVKEDPGTIKSPQLQPPYGNSQASVSYGQQQPYGSYAPQPAGYPQGSYYSSAGYPPYASSPPQNPHHQPYVPYPASGATSFNASYPYSAPPQTSFVSSTPAIVHDAAHPNARAGPEDLPSYEEMIVEALEACADPEGAPPKNMFLWMQSQYPSLHSNFRPSASQALQKALKRGRLEKNELGKYRVNRAWHGGMVSRPWPPGLNVPIVADISPLSQSSKRSRRPQSSTEPPASSQLSSALAATKPPAPLAPPTPLPAGGQQQPYGSAGSGTFAYGSGASWGTGVTTYFQAATTSTARLPVATPTSPLSGVLEQARSAVPPGVAPDDWGSAARAVFELISGKTVLPDGPAAGPDPALGGASDAKPPLAPPEAATAGSAVGAPMDAGSAPADAGDAGTMEAPAALSEHDRAALQAQLSLIAAQLADFGQMEEEDDDEYGDGARDAGGTDDRREEEEEDEGQGQEAQLGGYTWPASFGTGRKDAPMGMIAQEEEEDDDDDMEEVEVPVRTF